MNKRRVLTLITVGLLFWVLSAIVDYFTPPPQPFLDLLLPNVSSQFLFSRVVVLSMLVATGVLLGKHSTIPYQDSDVDELRKSNEK